MSVPTQTSAEPTPRIIVRDESDVRVLILALSLYAAHTHNESLASAAESLSEELARGPYGAGYSSRLSLTVEGMHTLPERG